MAFSSHYYEFLFKTVNKISSQSTSIFGVMDSKKGKHMSPYLMGGISMIRKRDKIDSNNCYQIIVQQTCSREADALVDDFGNNPPPEIRPQSYSGDIHDKED